MSVFIPAIRKTVVKLLYHFNPGNVVITHPYTKQKMTIHSFQHKGYWFHGKRREQLSMAASSMHDARRLFCR